MMWQRALLKQSQINFYSSSFVQDFFLHKGSRYGKGPGKRNGKGALEKDRGKSSPRNT